MRRWIARGAKVLRIIRDTTRVDMHGMIELAGKKILAGRPSVVGH